MKPPLHALPYLAVVFAKREYHRANELERLFVKRCLGLGSILAKINHPCVG
jgi:hypothetical protein